MQNLQELVAATTSWSLFLEKTRNEMKTLVQVCSGEAICGGVSTVPCGHQAER